MRLTDTDALWSYFKAGADWRTAQLTINLESLHDVIHSIGTVECAECKHWGGRNASGEVVVPHATCDLNVGIEDGPLPTHFGCPGFQRRQAWDDSRPAGCKQWDKENPS